MLPDKNHWLDLAQTHARTFADNTPFPHACIDNFLPPPLAHALLDAFPPRDAMESMTFQKYENKIAMRPDNPGFPKVIEDFLNAMNGGKIITFFEALTGIEGLIPDPHFNGGGLHQSFDGGKLQVHVDFNFNKTLNLYRRLNVLLYLNKGWQDRYGGHIELWNHDMTACEVKLAPVFNRCVVFETSSHSYHGHPTPMRLPPGMSRKSIALYYYTSAHGSQSKEPHWTRHLNRPGSRQDHHFKDFENKIYDYTPPLLMRKLRRLLSHLETPEP